MVKPLNYLLDKSFQISQFYVTSADGEKHLQILVELNMLIPPIDSRQEILLLI